MSSIPAAAWVSGFAQRLVPRAPFEVALTRDEDAVIFVHHGEEGTRMVRVVINPVASSEDEVNPQVALGRDVEGVGDALAFVENDPFQRQWSIVTRTMEMAFPPGTTFWSTPGDAGWAFELTQSAFEMPEGLEHSPDEMLYVQGPFESDDAPRLEDLIGDGMREKGSGKTPGRFGEIDWKDIAYEIESGPWVQRRQLVPLGDGFVALVTSQARESNTVTWEGIAEKVASSLCPRSREE